MPFFSPLKRYRWGLWLVLTVSFLSSLTSPLAALALRDWLGDFQEGDVLAYRSGSTVGMVKLVSLTPVRWQQSQIEASLFFNTPAWPSLLDANTSNDVSVKAPLSASGEFWQILLDLPLKRIAHPRSWRPKLAILSNVKGPIEWSVWQVNLPPLQGLPSTIRTLTLYVAQGSALQAAALPSPWPYWIENHETLHKWASYLVKSHRPRNPQPL